MTHRLRSTHHARSTFPLAVQVVGGMPKKAQRLLGGIIRETESVIDQALRSVPSSVGVEDYEEQIAAILRDFGDQASACFGRESGLHPFHARNTAK